MPQDQDAATIRAEVERLREALRLAESEARRYASYYEPASDGRNTFLMLADRIAEIADARAQIAADLVEVVRCRLAEVTAARFARHNIKIADPDVDAWDEHARAVVAAITPRIRAEERERAAKVCEEMASENMPLYRRELSWTTCIVCAATIREATP